MIISNANALPCLSLGVGLSSQTEGDYNNEDERRSTAPANVPYHMCDIFGRIEGVHHLVE